MDQIDLKIIELLKKNARMSYSQIGRIIHMSSPAVKNRMDILEEKIIENYTVTIKNPKKNFESFILFKTTHCDQLTKYCEGNPSIVEFHRISGEYNYLAKVQYFANSELDLISRETTSFAFSIVIPILR